MITFSRIKSSKKTQYLISLLLIIIVSSLSFIAKDVFGYKVVALLLLVAVSVIATIFDIIPVLISAILSALILNFFFIPPLYNFHIDNTEDILLFFMYIVVALVNAVLTVKIRDAEKKARDKEEKENAIKLYNTLFNSLSHELRTPISTIIGAVDVLKDNNERMTIANQKQLLSEIEIATIRLNRQVENLLNMNRLETGMLKLNVDWCDVNELIYSVIQKLDEAKQKHEIVFDENENLPFFKLDSGLLEHVIHNIIYNAIQYTPENSIIKIYVKEFNEKLQISIEDNGTGFSESEINLIFNKFYRLPNSKSGGTGLGLSIVKGYIEAHNGEINVQNVIPNGAKFIIEIPAEKSYINNLKNE